MFSYLRSKGSTVILFLLAILLLLSCQSTKENILIMVPEEAAFQEKLAAKELRRYLYASTGQLPTLEDLKSDLPDKGKFIVVSSVNHYLSRIWPADPDTLDVRNISDQGYLIKKITKDKREILWIIGGENNGVLYGVYCFLEEFGIGFYLHDDIIPDKKADMILPELDIIRNPLFELRGILPFHDFPEGPDWWTLQDYKAVIGQLPKMGMNFIGFHTYPESEFAGSYRAEPLVWIGLEEDIENDGRIRLAYPVLHFNTGDETWGYSPQSTSDYYYGAGKLFDRDNYGTDYMHNISPWPHTDSENISIFNESGKFFHSAFQFSKLLGVKTCVGTETDLTLPDKLADKLKNKGLSSSGTEVIKDVYKGIFTRISRTYPLDYYWLWTPESWTWNEVEEAKVETVMKDIELAHEALEEIGAPFRLATCGWVLGPPDDPRAFDSRLPKSIPFSCINRQVGFTPVETEFKNIAERSLWAIPWLEDDPALISPQLWVGRVRRDALDAYRYGCDGLMGIHWRTINVDPMASALSEAAWEIGDWAHRMKGDRDLDPRDFYAEWSRIQFGDNCPEKIAKIFTSLDGGPMYHPEEGKRKANLYRTSDWISGPGGLRKERMSQEEIMQKFGFITDLESLEDRIYGQGNKERFAYWINTFKYARATAILGNTLYEMDSLTEYATGLPHPQRKTFTESTLLPKRIKANQDWKAMITHLLKAVQTRGEMGTIANLQQHNMNKLNILQQYDDQIIEITGKPLPPQAIPDRHYDGPDRIIIPSRRTHLERGEDFQLEIILLSNKKVKEAQLHWRKFGEPRFQTQMIDFYLPGHALAGLSHSEIAWEDFEYYLVITLSDSTTLKFPSDAPGRTRTMVILP